MTKDDLRLVLNDIREDWKDTNLYEFIRWQCVKVKQGIQTGIWPWTN